MKKLTLIALMLCTLFAVQSCSKDEALDGKDGTNGKDGISGARSFMFTNVVHDGTFVDHDLTGITMSYIDSCAILVYYQDADNEPTPVWYQAPVNTGSNYTLKYFVIQYSGNPVQLSCQVRNTDGGPYSGPDVTFSKLKVVFIPHTLTGKKENVDLSDYKATMKYYGLDE